MSGWIVGGAVVLVLGVVIALREFAVRRQTELLARDLAESMVREAKQAAERKIQAAADAAAEEIRHAPLDDKIARARDIAARGKLRGDDPG